MTDPDSPCVVDGEVNGATNKREGQEHKEKVKEGRPALCNFRDQFSEARQAIQVTVKYGSVAMKAVAANNFPRNCASLIALQ